MTNRCTASMSLEEIAQRLGMSRQNVQLIEQRALRKLRIACRSKFRGPWKHYESEGVPEPAENHREYQAQAAKQSRRRSGKFAKKKPEAHRVDGMIAECVRKSESEGRVVAAE